MENRNQAKTKNRPYFSNLQTPSKSQGLSAFFHVNLPQNELIRPVDLERDMKIKNEETKESAEEQHASSRHFVVIVDKDHYCMYRPSITGLGDNEVLS